MESQYACFPSPSLRASAPPIDAWHASRRRTARPGRAIISRSITFLSYPPDELAAVVDSFATDATSKELVTKRTHQRWREMWCASRFGLGFRERFGDCEIEIDDVDEQRDFDFHLRFEGDRLPFQVATVLDKGRRPGDEYKTGTRAEIKGWYDTRPAQDEDYARRCVQRSLRAKVAKNYAAPQSLHVLLYLNLKAAGVPWVVLAEACKVDARRFASVWVTTDHYLCCLHGGTRWVTPPGWWSIWPSEQ